MSQETTKLTSKIIADAKAAVDEYATKIDSLNQELAAIMTTLKGADNFAGDASNGYQHFYNNTALPALTTNLNAAQGSLCASLKEILDSIETQLLKTVDPEMEKVNMNPGGEAAAE